MTGPLRVPDVEGWKPDTLGTGATALGTLVTKLDEKLQSMLIEQDDLAESWKGAGADAAARRVVNEKTAGNHISGKISTIKDALSVSQTELQDAKNFVINKRNGYVGAGFEVGDTGIVTAREKVRQLEQAGGDRGDVQAAVLAVTTEAGRHTLDMLGALRHAAGVADGVRAKLATAKSELNTLVVQEAPSKTLRALNPGQGLIAPPGFTPTGAIQALEEGRPVEVTTADGKTITLKPPENGGPPNFIESITDPDGTVHTTTRNPDGTITASVATPRSDGSGVIDTVVTHPDGSTTKLEQVPKSPGVTETYTVGPNGRSLVSTSTQLPDSRGVITEAKNGDQVNRSWTAPNGATVTYSNVIGADGQEQLVGVSNSAGYKGFIGPDGSVNMQFGEGKWGHLTQQPDGSTLVNFSDGSVLQTKPPEPGKPAAGPWDMVRSWSEAVAGNNPVSSTIDGTGKHPFATAGDAAASGTAEGAVQGGKSLAHEAGLLAQQSRNLGGMALQNPGSGHAGQQAAHAMELGDDAARLGSQTDMLSRAGKVGGPLASIGFSAYQSYDDWQHGKDGWEAVGSGAGSALGSIGLGAATGAAGGAWLGPPGAIGGAIIGGFVGSGVGGWAGENIVKAVK